jgi:hypothetical protein
VDEELLIDDLEEDLDAAVRTIKEAAEDALLEGKKVGAFHDQAVDVEK